MERPRRVEPLAPPSPTYDPDLDPPRFHPPGTSGGRPPLIPQEYQRLVANPFLAMLGLIVWFAAFRQALAARNLLLVGLALSGLAVVVYLLQYHCLDCGTTGPLLRWKSHACSRVLARQETGHVRRRRGPNPVFQTILWAYLIAAAAVLVIALRLAVIR
jgi:hypothetical protein